MKKNIGRLCQPRLWSVKKKYNVSVAACAILSSTALPNGTASDQNEALFWIIIMIHSVKRLNV